MAIEKAEPLPNASEGFKIVSERVTNDFAFIHDANEVKYEMTKFVDNKAKFSLWLPITKCLKQFMSQETLRLFVLTSRVTEFRFRFIFSFNSQLFLICLFFISNETNPSIRCFSAFQITHDYNESQILSQKLQLLNGGRHFCRTILCLSNSTRFFVTSNLICITFLSFWKSIYFFYFQDELSRITIELQKEHFFEDLTAKYWNSSSKASCLKDDDSEGITLESLGGVFIATLVGLGRLLCFFRDFFLMNY